MSLGKTFVVHVLRKCHDKITRRGTYFFRNFEASYVLKGKFRGHSLALLPLESLVIGLFNRSREKYLFKYCIYDF